MDLNRHLDGFQSFFSPDIQHGSSKYSKIFRVPRRWSSIPPIPHGTSKSYPPYTHMEVSQNGVPENGWFIRENPTKMDDLGVPLFEETTTSSQIARGVDPHSFLGLKNAPLTETTSTTTSTSTITVRNWAGCIQSSKVGGEFTVKNGR